MSAKKDNEIVIGGPPRIDFLPPEIHQKKEIRRTIRGLVVLVVLAIGVCIAAYAGVTTVAVAAQLGLEAEQARTTQLLQQQGDYFEARQAAAAVDAAKDARIVGSAYEILWADYLAEIDKTAPGSIVIAGLNIDSQSSIEGPRFAAGVLEKDHVATLAISAIAGSEQEFALWIDRMADLPGFSGAWLGQISFVEDGERYAGTITLFVNTDALEKRFFDGYGDQPEVVEQEPVTQEESTDDDATDIEGDN